MGDVYKVLARRKIPSTGLLSERLVIELCESVHLHYRSLRLEFTNDEFLRFAGAVEEAVRELRTVLQR